MAHVSIAKAAFMQPVPFLTEPIMDISASSSNEHYKCDSIPHARQQKSVKKGRAASGGALVSSLVQILLRFVRRPLGQPYLRIVHPPGLEYLPI